MAEDEHDFDLNAELDILNAGDVDDEGVPTSNCEDNGGRGNVHVK